MHIMNVRFRFLLFLACTVKYLNDYHKEYSGLIWNGGSVGNSGWKHRRSILRYVV